MPIRRRCKSTRRLVILNSLFAFRFYPATQYFRHAPGLGDAAAGVVRFTGIKYLTDRADAVVAEMMCKHLQEVAGSALVAGMNSQPRINERADQPGPNRSLMVSTVARPQIAAVNRLVLGIIR